MTGNSYQSSNNSYFGCLENQYVNAHTIGVQVILPNVCSILYVLI